MNYDIGNYAKTDNFKDILLLHRSCKSPVWLNAIVILQIKRLSSLYLNLKCGTSVSVNMLMTTWASPYCYLLYSITPSALANQNLLVDMKHYYNCGSMEKLPHTTDLKTLVNIQRD